MQILKLIEKLPLAMKGADSLIQSFLRAGTGLSVLEVLFSPQSSFFIVILALVLTIGFFVLLINRAILIAQLAALFPGGR